jgi:hypothetical protein
MAVCSIAATTEPAQAVEVNGGVSMGGVVAGIKPRLAVTPHAGVGWRADMGLFLGAHEMFGILPATDPHGAGVYSQTAADIGYAWDRGNLSLGPSIAVYSMPACNAMLCNRVVGLAPGVHAQANLYFADAFGLAIWGGVDWLGGSSLILPESMAAMVFAGPVLRLRTK